jgi:hypothetical protein
MLGLRASDPAIRSIYITEFGDPDQGGPLLEEWSPSRDIDEIVAPLFTFAVRTIGGCGARSQMPS